MEERRHKRKERGRKRKARGHSSEDIKESMKSVTDGTAEGDSPSTSSNSSENSEEPPGKTLKVSSPLSKAVCSTELQYAINLKNLRSLYDIVLQDPSQIDSDIGSIGFTALHSAAMSGEKEVVQMLLAAGANTKIQTLNQLETPLHLAIRYLKTDVAEVLVDWGVGGRLNDLQDDYGRTPLYWAAFFGCTELVKKLVAAGANTRLSDRAGHTPLHIAIYFNELGVVNALVDSGTAHDLQAIEDRSPLHFSALRGDAEICTKLLAAGCNGHLQDIYGSSPLHVALQECNYAAAMALVDFDPVNNVQDSKGMTPLHWASLKGHVEIVEKLLSSSANRHLRDKDGCTPLHVALRNKNEWVAAILIDSGAVGEIRDGDEPPLLHHPTMNQWEYVVRALLFFDVHPHVKDKEGVYPLEAALKEELDPLDGEPMPKNEKIWKMILAACSLKGVTIDWEELNLKPHEIQSCIELLSEYDIETQRMKSTTIPGTTVSYHDLAAKPVSTLAKYLRNEHVQEDLSSEMKDFPNYCKLIAFKMKRAADIKILTDQFLEDFVLCFRDLPSACIDIILLYLSNQDMKNFIEANKFRHR